MFTFNGMFPEAIYKYQLSLYDSVDSFEINYKKKSYKPKPHKRLSITVPIEFNFAEPRKNTIRSKKIEEMLKQK